MSHDDLEMVAYRILRFFDVCMKKGAVPTVALTKERAEAGNDRYFANVLEELLRNGYISGISVNYFYDGLGEPSIDFTDPRLTLTGAEFLRENDGMKKARKTAGAVFESAVEKSIAILLNIATGF